LLTEDSSHLDAVPVTQPSIKALRRYWIYIILWQQSTSCARGDRICPRPSPHSVGAQAPRAPPSRRNVAVLSHAEYVPTLAAAAALRVKAALSKAGYWLWPFDLESGVRVTCDVGYLCANFGLPSLSVLDLGPMYATDVSTDRRQTKASLNAPAY